MKEETHYLLLILLVGFLLRCWMVYTNVDAELYILWLSHFLKTGELLSYDHPPLFFIFSAAIFYFISYLKSLGWKVYWASFFFLGIFILDKKIKIEKKMIILALLSYCWVVGFFYDLFHITVAVSLITGMLTIYYTYRLGCLIFDKKIGLFSSLILAVLPSHIIYSSTPLIDSLAAFFILLSFYLYFSCFRRKEIGLGEIVILTIVFSLALYSKYYSVLPLFLLFLLTFFLKRNVRCFLPFIFSLLLFLPWMLFTNLSNNPGYAFYHYKFIVMPSPSFIFNFLLQFLTPIGSFLFFLSLFLLLKRSKKREEESLLLLFIIFPLFVYTLLAYFYKLSHFLINLSNYMLFTLPFFTILMALPLVKIVNKNWKQVFYISITFCFAYQLIFLPQFVEFEYDKNYLTIYGNLDIFSSRELSLSDIKNLSLMPLHFKYYFKGIEINKSPNSFGTTDIHGRWEDVYEYAIYSKDPREVNLRLKIIPLREECKKVKICFNTNCEDLYIFGPQEANFSLSLKAGKNYINFVDECNYCYLIKNGKCINFYLNVLEINKS